MPRFRRAWPVLLLLLASRAAGQDVAPSAPAASKAASDRTSLFRDIVVDPGEIYQDVTCFFCAITHRGTAQGDVTSFGARAEVDGQVSGEVISFGGSVHLGAKAHVAGDVTSLGGPLRKEAGATAGGDQLEGDFLYLPGQREIFVLGCLFFLAINLVLMGALWFFLPEARLTTLSRVLEVRRIWSAVWGVAAIALLIAIAAGHLPVRIQLILGWTLFAVEFLMFLLGQAGFSLWLGRQMRPAASERAAMFWGLSVFLVLCLVPIVGFVVYCTAVVVCTGMTAASLFGFAHLEKPPAPTK